MFKSLRRKSQFFLLQSGIETQRGKLVCPDFSFDALVNVDSSMGRFYLENVIEQTRRCCFIVKGPLLLTESYSSNMQNVLLKKQISQ